MKISARNALQGTITTVFPGAVNSEIDIDIGNGDQIVAIVTNGSVHSLALVPGKPVTALVKASSVLLMTDSAGLKLSARNCLSGVVKSLTPGAVNAEVTLTLKGGAEVHSIVTNDAVKSLGLAVGSPASAVIKASSVILGVPA